MIEQNRPDSDDITLSSIKKGLVGLLLVIYAILGSFYLFIFKHALVIIICTVLVGGIGYLVAMRTRPVYSLEMIVKPSDLTKRTYAEAIDQLNELASSKSYKGLSNELKISEGNVRNIKRLNATNIDGEVLSKDTSSRTDLPFIVKAEVYNNSIADSLQQMLLNYFNTNDYLRERKVMQKKVFEEKLIFIEGELKKLDSLKEQYNRFLNTSGKSAMFYNNAFNPVDIYQRSNEYQVQKEFVITWLNNETQTLKAIVGFKPSIRPVDGKRDKLVLYFSLAGLLLGFLLGAVLELKKLSKRRSG